MSISLPVGYITTQDGRLGIVGLWRKYRNASLVISLFLSCFWRAEEENCADEIMNGVVEYSEWNKFFFWRVYTPQMRERKFDEEFFSYTRTTLTFDQANKCSSVIYTLMSFVCGGRKLFGRKYEWDCWLGMKQLRKYSFSLVTTTFLFDGIEKRLKVLGYFTSYNKLSYSCWSFV